MKRIVETPDADYEGLTALLGERVTLFCLNYIYTGKLVAVGSTCAELQDAAIVYETGSFEEKAWKHAEKLPGAWFVQLGAVESFGILK